MKEIYPKRRTIEEVLNNPYDIPFYQRDYKWGQKQFSDLINDLQEDFFAYFSEEHSRSDVSQYGYYFLGSIITSDSEASSRITLIDGQQRLTSITLLLSYILLKRKKDSKIPNVAKWIYDESYGDQVYKITQNADAINLLQRIESGTHLELEEVGNDGKTELDNLNESSKNQFLRFNEIDDLLKPEIKSTLLPHFTDWLTKRVILIEIKVPTQQDAHKVFVTMNDRGLNLSPTEMLKGFILSNISVEAKRDEAHKLWREIINELELLGKDEDSNFIKTWLRSQYATDIRERTRNAEKKDYDLIGEAYHNWVYHNRIKLNLSTSEDYYKLITKEFRRFAKTYILIKKYENEISKGFEAIYYNNQRQFTLQSLLLMASPKKRGLYASN